MPDITQIGVGGIFVVLVLREVFSFLAKQRVSQDRASPCQSPDMAKVLRAIEALLRRSEDLHRWHAPDSSGKQVWKWDFGEKLDKLTRAIEDLGRRVDRGS